MGLDNVDLGVVIGISVSVALLLISVIVLCCYARLRKRKRKGKIIKKDKKAIENNGTKSHHVDYEQSRGEVAVDTNESSVNQKDTTNGKTDHSKNGKKSEILDKIDHEEIVQPVQNVADLYATVNKKKSKDTSAMRSLENVEVFIPDDNVDSGNMSRNSPDGAADGIMDPNYDPHVTEVKVIHETTTRKSSRDNVNNDSDGEVFIDYDVTKMYSNGGYLHENNEISFSSGDEEIEDRCSVASSKPSVSFHDNTYYSDYDHLKIRTTKVTSKASIDPSREESDYNSIVPAKETSRIIPPDHSGMARVFVASGGRKHHVKKRHRSEQSLSGHALNVGHLQVNPNQIVVPISPTYHQTGSRTLDKNAFSSRQVQYVPERYVLGYQPAVRDNISMRTDGGYAISEYAVPAQRRVYTSASTISSLGRDRSRSIDEPIYYVPSSRRGSIGSAYSLVASTYSPRQDVPRRYLPAGKLHKLHKPLSAFDLHKMKYRSYKGKLAPYSIPL